MTSSDDRKWSSAHVGGGPVWSMLRMMLDVSLLRRPTFVVLALSVLLCYFGRLLTSYKHCCYVAAKATYIRLLYGQKGGFSALAP